MKTYFKRIYFNDFRSGVRCDAFTRFQLEEETHCRRGCPAPPVPTPSQTHWRLFILLLLLHRHAPPKKGIFFTATITLPPDPHNTMLKGSRTRAGAVTCLLDKLNIESTGGEGVFAPSSVSL